MKAACITVTKFSFFDGGVRILCPRLRCGKLGASPRDGLIYHFKPNNNIRIFQHSVFTRHVLQDGNRTCDICRLLPEEIALPSRIVESVLEPGGSMTIDPDFHPCIPRPSYGKLKIRIRTFDIRRTCIIVRLEPNRNTKSIYSCCSESLNTDFCKVG
jgi:hypothetical protein